MRRVVVFAISYWLLILLAASLILALLGRWSGDEFELEDWLGLIAIFGLQIMLLIAPSRMSAGLPVSRRLLLVPLLASGFLLGFLLFGLEMAIGECTRLLNDFSIWLVMTPAAAGIAYVFILHRMGRRMDTSELFRKQRSTLLFAGFLVLIMTIPAHVLTVRRGGFLVGIGTGTGLIISVLAILFAVGQLLFARIFKEGNGEGLHA